MFEQSTVSTILLDPDGNGVGVNSKFCELFGVTPVGMKHYKLFEDEATKQSDAYEPLMDVFNNKNSHRWRNSFDIALASESSGVKTTKPETVHLENLSYPIVDKDGNLQYAVIQHHNITKIIKTDQALQESELFLSSLLNQSPYPTWISDKNGLLIDANPALLKTLNLTRDQIVNVYNDFDDTQATDYMRQRVREVLIDGTIFDFEMEWSGAASEIERIKDSNKVYIEVTIFPINNTKGEITNAVITQRDISDRKKAEDALKDSEEKYRNYIEEFRGIAYHGSMESIPFFFQGAVEEITGYTEQELINASPSWVDIVLPEDFKNILEPQIEEISTIPDTKLTREFRIIHKNGSIRWIREHLNNVSENGIPVACRGALYDITDNILSQQTLAGS